MGVDLLQNTPEKPRALRPAEGIPHELIALRQWVLWRYELVGDSRGEPRWTKIPYQANGRKASSTNADTWCDFDSAWSLVGHADAGVDGLGFVFTGADPYCGIDLDKCMLGGKASEFASSIVSRLRSYTELSPSGTGLHIIAQAKLSDRGKNDRKRGIEIYDRGRFFVMTGHSAGWSFGVEDRQSEVDSIINDFWPANSGNGNGAYSPLNPERSETNDAQVLTLAYNSRNGAKIQKLYSGDWSDYGSQSEADLALCCHLAYWSGGNPQVVDRLFRLSGLMRAKWERDDYREATIGKAMSSRESFSPKKELPKKTIEPLAASAASQRLTIPDDRWPDPQPLILDTVPEQYPLDTWPAPARAAIEEVHSFAKAPIPLVATSALAAMSLATQAHANVRRANRLVGPVSTYSLVIADSGERKTTCDGYFTQALREYDIEQEELAAPDLKRYRAELADWESRHRGVTDAIRSAAKKGKSTESDHKRLQQLEDERPKPPRIPHLLYGDATPEAQACALARRWPSGGVLSSEASIVFGSHGMSEESVMRNLGMLNVLWDGGDLAIDRKTSESFVVRGARFTLGLQVQEATLRAVLDKIGPLARGSGFLARFLIAWPASTQGHRPFTEAPESWPALTRFNTGLRRILAAAPAINERGELEPPALDMSPDAKRAWVTYYDQIEVELRAGGELQDVRDVAAKISENAARVAALFHVFEHSTQGEIGADSIESAIRIVTWHLTEARRFFGELCLPPEIANAARLGGWLVAHAKRKGVDRLPRREVQQFVTPVRLRDSACLDLSIHGLEEAGWLRIVKEGKRVDILLNPAVLA